MGSSRSEPAQQRGLNTGETMADKNRVLAPGLGSTSGAMAGVVKAGAGHMNRVLAPGLGSTSGARADVVVGNAGAAGAGNMNRVLAPGLGSSSTPMAPAGKAGKDKEDCSIS